MTKKLAIAWFLVLLLVTLIGPGCTPKVPVFTFSNLSVSPAEIVSGDNVTFSVEVKNTGNGEGIKPVSFLLDGVSLGEQNVTLKPEISQNVAYTAVQNSPGPHTLKVGDLTQDFIIKKAAEFQVSALNITGDKCEPGADVICNVDVSNLGEVSGDYKLVFQLDGAEVGNKTGTLPGGEKATVGLTLNSDKPGTHNVAVGELTYQFTVLKPAEIKLSNLKISPAQITAGQAATVMVDMTNAGEVKGEYDIPLKIGGQTVDSKKGDLAGGATETLNFTVTEDIGGEYTLVIGELTGNLIVQEGILPVLHVGDQWVYRVNEQGALYTRTETITGEEIINGKSCWVVRETYNPKYVGLLSEITLWLDKTTCARVMEQTTMESQGISVNMTITYTSTHTGTQWPMKVGNQFSESLSIQAVAEGNGNRKVENSSQNMVGEIIKMTTITTNAGTFRCFETKSTVDGTTQMTQWYSDKAKAVVKYTTADGTRSEELLSYSVKQ